MGPDRLLRAPADEDAQPRCNGGEWSAHGPVLCGRSKLHTDPRYGVNWPNQRPHRRLSGGAIHQQTRKSIVISFRDAGYATAHFGKWHLNYSGVGLEHPLEADDPHNPGELGFDYWVSHTSGFDLFDLDGGRFALSRMGTREVFQGMDPKSLLMKR
ncbi:MAG: hypothetical protein CM15mP120_09550 [Pseudomonadota bacterium]|nr:MAG: hypothetical protein CM15mP120_09550 [Pseudomonadota bacterium]